MSHDIFRRTALLLAAPLLGLAALLVSGLPSHAIDATGGASASARDATTHVMRGGAPAAAAGRVARIPGTPWRQPSGR